MGSCFGLISVHSAKDILQNRAHFLFCSSLEHQLISAIVQEVVLSLNPHFYHFLKKYMFFVSYMQQH